MRFDRLVLIVLLLVLPVAVWPGSTSYDAAKFTVLALAGACWLGNLAWKMASGRRVHLPRLSLVIVAVSLLAVLSASAFRAPSGSLVVRTVSLTALWLAVLIQTSLVTDSPARMHLVLAAGVVSGVAVSTIGLFQMAGWLPGAPPSSGYPAGISTLGNQNYVSGLAAVLISPSIILWAQNTIWRKTVAIAGTLVLATTVLLAGAAGPWLGILGSAFLIGPAVLMNSRNMGAKIPKVLAGSLLVLGLCGGVLLVGVMKSSPEAVGPRQPIHRRVFLENHGAVRRTNWLVAEEMFRSSPLTGTGAGNYQVLWPKSRAMLFHEGETIGLAPFQPRATRAHNEYFQFLGETGILGALWALTCLGMTLAFWNHTWLGLASRRTRGQFLLLTGGLFTAGLHALVSFPFHLPATSLMLAMILGLLFSRVFQASAVQSWVWSGPRILAILPALVCLLVGAGSLREFTGDRHIAAGRRHFAFARLDPAFRILSKGATLSQWPSDGLLYLGLVQAAGGRAAAARPSLENSLALKPTFAGYLALAELSIDQGRFTEAAELLDIVDGCEPFVELGNQAAYLRGLSELRQDRVEQAYLQFRLLLENDPANQRAWLALGYLAVLAGEQEKGHTFYARAQEIVGRKISILESGASEPHPGEIVRLYHHREIAQRALQSLK